MKKLDSFLFEALTSQEKIINWRTDIEKKKIKISEKQRKIPELKKNGKNDNALILTSEINILNLEIQRLQEKIKRETIKIRITK